MRMHHRLPDGQLDYILESGDNTTRALRATERHLFKIEGHAQKAKESSEKLNRQADVATSNIEGLNDTLVIKSDAGLSLFSEALEAMAWFVDEVSEALESLRLNDVASSLPRDLLPLLVPIILLLLILICCNSHFGFLLANDPLVQESAIDKVVQGFAILHVVTVCIVGLVLLVEFLQRFQVKTSEKEDSNAEEVLLASGAAEDDGKSNGDNYDSDIDIEDSWGLSSPFTQSFPLSSTHDFHKEEINRIEVQLAICRAKLQAASANSRIGVSPSCSRQSSIHRSDGSRPSQLRKTLSSDPSYTNKLSRERYPSGDSLLQHRRGRPLPLLRESRTFESQPSMPLDDFEHLCSEAKSPTLPNVDKHEMQQQVLAVPEESRHSSLSLGSHPSSHGSRSSQEERVSRQSEETVQHLRNKMRINQTDLSTSPSSSGDRSSQRKRSTISGNIIAEHMHKLSTLASSKRASLSYGGFPDDPQCSQLGSPSRSQSLTGNVHSKSKENIQPRSEESSSIGNASRDSSFASPNAVKGTNVLIV